MPRPHTAPYCDRGTAIDCRWVMTPGPDPEVERQAVESLGLAERWRS